MPATAALVAAAVTGAWFAARSAPVPPLRLFRLMIAPPDGALATGGWTYDVSKDGRFLMMKSAGEAEPAAPAPTSIVVVQNFGEELKRLLPTK